MNYEITHPTITSHDANDDDFANRRNCKKEMKLFNFGCANGGETTRTKKMEQTFENLWNNGQRETNLNKIWSKEMSILTKFAGKFRSISMKKRKKQDL